MSEAFVDTSMMLTLAFGEPDAAAVRKRLSSFDRLLASPLLEAEFRSACLREGVHAESLLLALTFVHVVRPLSNEIARVLSAGYLRGADCWHVATALYLSPNPRELTLLTRDEPQRKMAKALGFRT